jgi:hypothetical protein
MTMIAMFLEDSLQDCSEQNLRTRIFVQRMHALLAPEERQIFTLLLTHR